MKEHIDSEGWIMILARDEETPNWTELGIDRRNIEEEWGEEEYFYRPKSLTLSFN